MSTTEVTPKCAACGKGGDGLKTCNGCKLVKYCNATCQKAHRPDHKKECKKRAAEQFDEALFKEPQREECDICMLPLPLLASWHTYQECCGKTVCMGCMYADRVENHRLLCPFCRTPDWKTQGEYIERLNKRAEGNDAAAVNVLANTYLKGSRGLPQDNEKANELWLRAGKLGDAMAYNNIGNSYYQGRGVERDLKKAKHYWELAAVGGYVAARHNLGGLERNEGNMSRAMKHWMNAAGAGWEVL